MLDELGLTYTQWIIVLALSDGDVQTVTALGEKLFLESSTLTPVLKRMEREGIVRRQRGRVDERQVMVSLTDKGQALRPRGAGRPLGSATSLPPAEVAQARTSVVRVRDSLLDQLRGGPSSRAKKPGLERRANPQAA
jgi:DNA-binding MarR family transcriptional regulator